MAKLPSLPRPSFGVITLVAGETYVGGSLYRMGDLRLVGNGATVQGEVHVNGCGSVEIENVKFSGGDFCLKVDQCGSLSVTDCTATGAKVTCFETANTPNVLFQRCTATGAKTQHGFYLSERTLKGTLISCTAISCHRSGIQVNADPYLSTAILVQGCRVDKCQAAGAGGIQLSGVVPLPNNGSTPFGARILSNIVSGHLGRAAVALWDDGSGPCADVTIDGNVFEFAPGKGHANISVAGGCKNVVIGKNTYWPGLLEVEADAASTVVRR